MRLCLVLSYLLISVCRVEVTLHLNLGEGGARNMRERKRRKETERGMRMRKIVLKRSPCFPSLLFGFTGSRFESGFDIAAAESARNPLYVLRGNVFAWQT